ncbi:FtsK/SpoIIIE domain-containing protein [Bacillus infantis]|uniref:FtsK/SpoIIIE domain-containing protein n=1 Tax=Bacillus infantis TaxID=324767 RepID=UPI002FBE1A2F
MGVSYRISKESGGGMFIEIASSVVAAGILGSTYLYQAGISQSDHQKIEKIAENCGLVAKDGKKIRIHRRTRLKNGAEYVYQLPLGMSVKQFQERLENFQDGLNIKRSVVNITWEDIKGLRWNRNVLSEVRNLLQNKKKLHKEVEISYDGMLIFRVYDDQLPTMVELDDQMIIALKGWEVPIGLGRSGMVKHDFEKVCHFINAGTTDFGKSNWLKMVIAVLIRRKPKAVTFTLIDLKGGLSFIPFKKATQVSEMAKTPEEAYMALKTAQERMENIFNHLVANDFENVIEAGILERHFVIIDEAADIADDKACQEIITDIARRGRAAGLRLIYCTQYPTRETVGSQIKRNCIGRLSFVVDSGTASMVVIDQYGAESLPLVKGRAIYKTVRSEVVQTPYVSREFIDQTVGPYINMRSKKEDPVHHEKNGPEGAAGRKHSLIIEEA